MKNQEHTYLEQKDETTLDFFFFLQIFLGVVLLVKAADGLFPLFSAESYAPAAQELFSTIKSLPVLDAAITTGHFIVGAFLLWNAFVPFFAVVSGLLMLFATTFEAIYGTAIIPQLVTITALLASIAVIYHHKDEYNDLLKYKK